MDFADFAFTVLNNEVLFALLFLVFAIFYYFTFYRRLSFNVFDAFTVEMISSAGAALSVYIIFVYGSPDKKYLFSFLTCEIALYTAIFLVKWIATTYASPAPLIGSVGLTLTEAKRDYLRVFFFLVSFSFVVLQLVSFKLVGLILFSTEEGVTHVNAYDSYGPLFIILFVMNPLFLVCLFMKRKIFKQFSLFDYGCMAVALFSMFTSGSKASFVTFFTAFAVVDYKWAKLENKPKAKIPNVFLILFFVSIIAILSFGNITTLNDDSAISKLFQRIALSGDCFVIGYDDSALRFVRNGPGKTAFGYIFYPMFGKFVKHFTSTPITPSIVGSDLYYYAFGIDDAGSNGRHNILSVIFWGPYWGWLLSFLIGSFIGYIRFYLFEKVGYKNLLYLVFVCALTTIVPTCITDIYLFNSMLFMLITLFVVFVIMTVVVYEVSNIAKAVILHYLMSAQLKKDTVIERG